MEDSRGSTEGIRALMEQRGKSFADLKDAGIRPSQIRLLERGNFGSLRASTLVELSETLECSLADLFGALGRD